jgi:hypothetical protein
MRFVSGGSDGLVKYWTYNSRMNKFSSEVILSRDDWIRDVSFARENSLGIGFSDWAGGNEETLAIVSENMGGLIMRRKATGWETFELPMQTTSAVRIAWDSDTTELSVIYQDGSTKAFEEEEPGRWKEIEENDNPLQL